MNKPGVLWIAAFVLYLLHQDIWFWRTARPLVFGILPVGLAYHAAYTIAIAGLMFLLVRHAWPQHLERQIPRTPHRGSNA